MIKKVLIGLIVVGNFAVWGMAYYGYNQYSESKIAAAKAEAVKGKPAEIIVGSFKSELQGTDRSLNLGIALHLMDQENFKTICSARPKIEKAITQLIERFPPRKSTLNSLDNGLIDFGRLRLRILAEANRVTGKSVFDAAKLTDRPQLLEEGLDVPDAILKLEDCPVNPRV